MNNKENYIKIEELPEEIVCCYNKIKKTNYKGIKSTHKIKYKEIKRPYWRLRYNDEKYYYKLIFFDNDKFNKQVRVNEAFKKAIDCNFFVDLALVDNYIYDSKNDLVIGYKYPKLNLTKDIKSKNVKTSKSYINDNFNNMTEKFINLYNILLDKIKEHSIVYTDLTISNIVEKDNRYYLIDLDSVSFVNICNNKKILTERYKPLPQFYKKFLLSFTPLEI